LKRYIFYTGIVIFVSLSPLFAQTPVSVFWEPDISYTWPASDKWSYNTKFVGRTGFVEQNEAKISLQRLETHFFATRKLFGGQRISGGYMLRWVQPFFEKDFGYEHRFTQQLAFITYIGERRFGSRLRTEQRIRNRGFINRFRYRLSYDLPLVGEQLDPGETYLILSNEVLTSFNAKEVSFENRAYIGLGWYFNEKRKLETGLQYRTENIGPTLEHVFQLVSSYYINR
jgi:hypothetical protein